MILRLSDGSYRKVDERAGVRGATVPWPPGCGGASPEAQGDRGAGAEPLREERRAEDGRDGDSLRALGYVGPRSRGVARDRGAGGGADGNRGWGRRCRRQWSALARGGPTDAAASPRLEEVGQSHGGRERAGAETGSITRSRSEEPMVDKFNHQRVRRVARRAKRDGVELQFRLEGADSRRA